MVLSHCGSLGASSRILILSDSHYCRHPLALSSSCNVLSSSRILVLSSSSRSLEFSSSLPLALSSSRPLAFSSSRPLVLSSSLPLASYPLVLSSFRILSHGRSVVTFSRTSVSRVVPCQCSMWGVPWRWKWRDEVLTFGTSSIVGTDIEYYTYYKGCLELQLALCICGLTCILVKVLYYLGPLLSIAKFQYFILG